MPSGSVFVVISCQGVTDAIRDAVDQGQFNDARALSYKTTGLARKLASQVQEKGGHLTVFIPERQVMEVPSSVAEDMPSYIEPYMQELPGMVAVGMGLTFGEAVMAMKTSLISGEIEMYDPKDSKFGRDNEYAKADAEGSHSEMPYQLPVNMFDVTVPETEPVEPNNEGFVSRPEVEEELQAQAALIQALAQLMTGGQQPQPGQPGQPGQDPRDLREALEGGPVEGYQPQEEGEGKGSEKKPKKESKKKDSDEKAEKDDEEGGAEKRLGKILSDVKASLPQIMALHDKNPAAYKAAMTLVQKLDICAFRKNRRST